jgi:hypothetical protein
LNANLEQWIACATAERVTAEESLRQSQKMILNTTRRQHSADANLIVIAVAITFSNRPSLGKLAIA